MKNLLTLLFAYLVSITVFGQVSEINTLPNDNFTYDGTILNHYGVGFHNYFDEQDGVNLYGSGYFGIDLFTGGLHRFRISRYGNVGIGTNNPKSKLVVSDGLNGISFNPCGVNGLGFNRNAADGAIFNSAITAWQFSARTDRFSLEGYNGAEAVSFHVLKNGNVGIGTPTPNSKLEIYETGNNSSVSTLLKLSQFNTANAISGTGAALDFSIGNNANTPITAGKISVINTNYNQNSKMVFSTKKGNILTDQMILTADGNLLIGQQTQNTTYNNYRLDVNGIIHAQAMFVDFDNTADFVFDPAYKLMPLNEVEAYVKENKHLPEITSAKEVDEKGLNVGEMQNKLLQKVEELTLYVIELEKINKIQQEKLNRVDKLEKDLESLKAAIANK